MKKNRPVTTNAKNAKTRLTAKLEEMQKQKKEDTTSNYIYDGNDDMGFDDKKSDTSGYVDNG